MSPLVEDMVHYILMEESLCGEDLSRSGQIVSIDIHLARYEPATDGNVEMNHSSKQ